MMKSNYKDELIVKLLNRIEDLENKNNELVINELLLRMRFEEIKKVNN